MAKRKRTITEGRILKWIKEGRGTGSGPNYKPWLTVQDVPSQGLSSRLLGWKTNREHHLLSNLELHYLYYLEWSDSVTDIREQFPLLPLKDTLKIASKIGLKHPEDPKTRQPVVMTTDFIVTVSNGLNGDNLARTCKYVKDLEDYGVQEKLEIERVYWQIRDVDWGIITERELNMALVKNVERVHTHKSIKNLSDDIVTRVESLLKPRIQEGDLALSAATNDCDDRLMLDPGTSLMIVKHLLANKWWKVSMTEEIRPELPLQVPSFSDMPRQPQDWVTI